MWQVKKFLFIVFAFLFIGCSAERRAIRAIRKAERLAPEMFVDTTIRVPVEIAIPERTAVGRFPLEFDRPVTVEQDGVATEVLVTHDTIYVSTVVEADTLTAEGEAVVPVIKPTVTKDDGGFFDGLERLLWIVIAILVLALVINLTRK